MPREEGCQELEQYGLESLKGDPSARPVQQQAGEHRRDDDAQQVGSRRRRNGRGHISPGDGCKADGRLDGRGQAPKEEKTGCDTGWQDPGWQALGQKAEGREEEEGRGQDQNVQSPMGGSGDHRVAGQAGTMQEEDQANSQRDGDLEEGAGLTLRRKKGRQHDHA